jgi:putative ABC transport system permease protein
MNLLENIRLAIGSLISNKMRALLTMLGIIIGIGSVIAITSVGNAMTTSVNSAMSSFGVSNIQVYLSSRDNQSASIGPDDAITDDMITKYLKKFGDKISAVGFSESVGLGEIKNKHITNKVTVTGSNNGYAVTDNIKMLKGRYINEKDVQRTRNVAVISEKLAANLFSKNQNPLGSEVKVETATGLKAFTIIGVYSEPAPSQFMARNDTRTDFYIPVTTAKKMTGSPAGYYRFAVGAKIGEDYTRIAKETQDYFNTFYKNNRKLQCTAISLEAEISEVNNMMGTMSLAISVIAAISLLVGGIGVMNIMLVSVTERTREIGIRKALGAPDRAIRSQFVIESMIICIIGGILGIIVGGLLGYVGGVLLKQPAVPSLDSIAIAVGFSMAIGLFFGYYPANKAAKLDPIEALRYE